MQVSYWLNRRVTNFCNTFTGGEPVTWTKLRVNEKSSQNHGGDGGNALSPCRQLSYGCGLVYIGLHILAYLVYLYRT